MKQNNKIIEQCEKLINMKTQADRLVYEVEAITEVIGMIELVGLDNELQGAISMMRVIQSSIQGKRDLIVCTTNDHFNYLKNDVAPLIENIKIDKEKS